MLGGGTYETKIVLDAKEVQNNYSKYFLCFALSECFPAEFVTMVEPMNCFDDSDTERIRRPETGRTSRLYIWQTRSYIVDRKIGRKDDLSWSSKCISIGAKSTPIYLTNPLRRLHHFHNTRIRRPVRHGTRRHGRGEAPPPATRLLGNIEPCVRSHSREF